MHMQSTARYGHVSLVFQNSIKQYTEQDKVTVYSTVIETICSTPQLTNRDTRTHTLDIATTFRVHIAYDDVKVVGLLSSDTAHNYSCTGEMKQPRIAS